MGFEDVAYGLIADFVTEVGQRALNTVVAPGRILASHLQYEFLDFVCHRRAPGFIPLPVAVVPFSGDQFAVPAKDRIWRKQEPDLLQALAS